MRLSIPELLGATPEYILKSWPELTIHREDERIEESDVQAYLSHPQRKLEILIENDGRASSIFFYEEHELLDYLPVGFSATRGGVRNALGLPERSGEQFKDVVLGAQGAWDRYLLELYAIHFQYMFDAVSVAQITCMTLDTAKRIG
ncbi:MAG: hypothetical protein AAGI68_08550 [Planctomycetota bacterium]